MQKQTQSSAWIPHFRHVAAHLLGQANQRDLSQFIEALAIELDGASASNPLRPVRTPYLNTIPPDLEPDYPGDLALEARIENLVRCEQLDAGISLASSRRRGKARSSRCSFPWSRPRHNPRAFPLSGGVCLSSMTAMQASLSRVPFGRMQDEVTRLGFGLRRAIIGGAGPGRNGARFTKRSNA